MLWTGIAIGIAIGYAIHLLDHWWFMRSAFIHKCAWCGKLMRADWQEKRAISHGMCMKCFQDKRHMRHMQEERKP